MHVFYRWCGLCDAHVQDVPSAVEHRDGVREYDTCLRLQCFFSMFLVGGELVFVSLDMSLCDVFIAIFNSRLETYLSSTRGNFCTANWPICVAVEGCKTSLSLSSFWEHIGITGIPGSRYHWDIKEQVSLGYLLQPFCYVCSCLWTFFFFLPFAGLSECLLALFGCVNVRLELCDLDKC